MTEKQFYKKKMSLLEENRMLRQWVNYLEFDEDELEEVKK